MSSVLKWGNLRKKTALEGEWKGCLTSRSLTQDAALAVPVARLERERGVAAVSQPTVVHFTVNAPWLSVARAGLSFIAEGARISPANCCTIIHSIPSMEIIRLVQESNSAEDG